MNDIVNKFLLAGDNFMPEMHLKQPGFTYSDREPFTKNREGIQTFLVNMHGLFLEKIKRV